MSVHVKVHMFKIMRTPIKVFAFSLHFHYRESIGLTPNNFVLTILEIILYLVLCA